MESEFDQFIYYPDHLQKELFEILDDIFDFAVHTFRSTLVNKTENIVSQLNVTKDVENNVFTQIIYWSTFCSPIGIENMTIYQHYLLRNKTKMRKKSVQVQKLLVKWLFLNPGFYVVEQDSSLSGRVFILRDIFDKHPKLVCIFHTRYPQLQRGDLITGLMIPMGDDSYTALRGFIKIPVTINATVASQLLPHFREHATSRNYQANPQLYPSLLHITLQQMEKGTKSNEFKI